MLLYSTSRTILIASAKEALTDYFKKQVRQMDLTLSPNSDSEMQFNFFDEPVLSITEEEMPTADLRFLQETGKIVF